MVMEYQVRAKEISDLEIFAKNRSSVKKVFTVCDLNIAKYQLNSCILQYMLRKY